MHAHASLHLQRSCAVRTVDLEPCCHHAAAPPRQAAKRRRQTPTKRGPRRETPDQ